MPAADDLRRGSFDEPGGGRGPCCVASGPGSGPPAGANDRRSGEPIPAGSARSRRLRPLCQQLGPLGTGRAVIFVLVVLASGVWRRC